MTSAKPDLMGQITPVSGEPSPGMGQMPMMGAVPQAPPVAGVPAGGAAPAAAAQQMPPQMAPAQGMVMGYMAMGGQMAGLLLEDINIVVSALKSPSVSFVLLTRVVLLFHAGGYGMSMTPPVGASPGWLTFLHPKQNPAQDL